MLDIAVPTLVIIIIVALILTPNILDLIIYFIYEREKKRKNKDE